MIMEYQEIINLLGKEVTQPSKCRTKIWVEIIGDAHRMQNTNSQIKLKITMLKSSVCDYNNAYILVKRATKIIVASN